MPHGTDSLLLQLFTIFVWAKVFGELFERLYMPAVLGEILAGVILGPYATRFIIPGKTIYSVAEIGTVFLLFTVGLETAPSDLIRVGRLSLEVALAALIVALIGLQMNVISPRSYALVIVTTAVTTVLPAPFLRMLFTHEDTVEDHTSPGELLVEAQVPGELG